MGAVAPLSEPQRCGTSIAGRRAATFGVGPLGVLRVSCAACRRAESVKLLVQVMTVVDGDYASPGLFWKPACRADVISIGMGRMIRTPAWFRPPLPLLTMGSSAQTLPDGSCCFQISQPGCT